MKWIVKLVENHLWFIERSNQFMRGTPRIHYFLRYPIAYLRFMSNAMKCDIKELILVRGLPGSGKSTFAEVIGGFRCEADMYFMEDGEYKFDVNKIKEAHEWCKFQCQSFMSREKPKVIVSNTFTQAWEMDAYYELAKQYGYKVTSVIVENRHDGESIHDVNISTMNKMRNRFSIKL